MQLFLRPERQLRGRRPVLRARVVRRVQRARRALPLPRLGPRSARGRRLRRLRPLHTGHLPLVLPLLLRLRRITNLVRNG